MESKKVLKQLAKSHKYLVELKGYSDLIPNKDILINSIILGSLVKSVKIKN